MRADRRDAFPAIVDHLLPTHLIAWSALLTSIVIGAAHAHAGETRTLAVGGAIRGPVYFGGGRMFAEQRYGSDVYEWNEADHGWAKVGGPGNAFAADDRGRLFGTNETGVFQYTDRPNEWVQVGNPVRSIMAGGDKLYAAELERIVVYSGTAFDWTQIGVSALELVVDSEGHLYALANDKNVELHLGIDQGWEQIGGASEDLIAGGGRLCSIAPVTGDIWQYDGTPHQWTRIGGPGQSFAIDDQGHVYGTPDGRSIYLYSNVPDQWTHVANCDTRTLWAGNDGVVWYDEQTESLMQYRPMDIE
jgi:hypothetical protein